jgi:hypothetical protein
MAPLTPNYANLTIILLGHTHDPFCIHTDYLTTHSPFFASACTGRTILLPEIDPPAFRTYLRWLYAGEINSKEDAHDQAKLCALYLPGEHFQDVRLKNRVMEI